MITYYTWYRTPDVAVIVPLFDNTFIDKSTLVMIRESRHPLRKVLLEFPAGHTENNEDPKKTVTRQLLEETGYHAREIEQVYTYNPSVNISKQLIHIFRGTNLVKGEYEHSDSIEDIRNVEIISVEKLKHMIIAGKAENAGTLIGYFAVGGLDIRRFIGKAVSMDDLVRHANREIDCDYGYRRM